MRQTPRERLYDRALRGRWQRFSVSPEPFYDRLANGFGEGHLPKGATFRLARRIEAARDRLQRQTAKDPAARWPRSGLWLRGATGRWGAATTPTE